MAEQPGLALACRQQTGEHLHCGGFAATVGTEKAEDLAASDAEADMVHGREVTKTHGQVTGLNGDFIVLAGDKGRDHDGPVAALLLFRQQGDEGRLQRSGVGSLVQFLWRAGGQDSTGIHCHQPVETLGFVHVGRGDDHAHTVAFTANAPDQIPELAARQRIDAGGGLVKDQQVRVVDQRTAQAQFLLHAA